MSSDSSRNVGEAMNVVVKLSRANFCEAVFCARKRMTLTTTRTYV